MAHLVNVREGEESGKKLYATVLYRCAKRSVFLFFICYICGLGLTMILYLLMIVSAENANLEKENVVTAHENS